MPEGSTTGGRSASCYDSTLLTGFFDALLMRSFQHMTNMFECHLHRNFKLPCRRQVDRCSRFFHRYGSSNKRRQLACIAPMKGGSSLVRQRRSTQLRCLQQTSSCTSEIQAGEGMFQVLPLALMSQTLTCEQMMSFVHKVHRSSDDLGCGTLSFFQQKPAVLKPGTLPPHRNIDVDAHTHKIQTASKTLLFDRTTFTSNKSFASLFGDGVRQVERQHAIFHGQQSLVRYPRRPLPVGNALQRSSRMRKVLRHSCNCQPDATAHSQTSTLRTY